MDRVASESTSQKHHPEWSNVYNTTFIRWTTHSPAGLSGKDILMARFCDRMAALSGELESEDSEGIGKALVERVGIEGLGCCVPKKKGGVAGEKS